jgi:4,5-DOPA dioxygenase extradiol
MKRRNFLQTLVWLPLTSKAMTMTDLEMPQKQGSETEPMPVLFIGHGSPMNAIEDNEFSRSWQALGKTIPTPRAVLCVSAHWETKGTFVTAMENPRTIHDFYGFPDNLFAVQYPAKGSPELAKETQDTSGIQKISADYNWGLDHGCWSVLKHLLPDAGVPVIQLSLDYSLSPSEHYSLASQLATLRRKGVLIMGSGNIIHNLRMLNWKNPGKSYPWAEEAESKIRKLILSNNHKELFKYSTLGSEMELAIPTPEHFLPLLYVLGLKEKNEQITFFNDKRVFGSLSMTSILIK